MNIPRTMACTIKSTGELYNDSMVKVFCPFYQSIIYAAGASELSDVFDVKLRITNGKSIISDGNMKATLICEDNDVINMYVEV